MPRFKMGDHVERIGSLIPFYMKSGVITGVYPNKDGNDGFTEYEVNFGHQIVGVFYENQLKLAERP